MAVAADWRTGESEHQRIGFRSAAGSGIAEAVLIVDRRFYCVSAKTWNEETLTRSSMRVKNKRAKKSVNIPFNPLSIQKSFTYRNTNQPGFLRILTTLIN